MSAKTERKERSDGVKSIFRYLKAILVSLIVTFACIILFAFIIKWASLGDEVISPVNLVIKALSVFLGVLIITKGRSKGILNGVMFALVYTFISFLVFSCLAGTFMIGLGLVADFGFNAVIGVISGILGVNLRRKN